MRHTFIYKMFNGLKYHMYNVYKFWSKARVNYELPCARYCHLKIEFIKLEVYMSIFTLVNV